MSDCYNLRWYLEQFSGKFNNWVSLTPESDSGLLSQESGPGQYLVPILVLDFRLNCLVLTFYSGLGQILEFVLQDYSGPHLRRSTPDRSAAGFLIGVSSLVGYKLSSLCLSIKRHL